MEARCAKEGLAAIPGEVVAVGPSILALGDHALAIRTRAVDNIGQQAAAVASTAVVAIAVDPVDLTAISRVAVAVRPIRVTGTQRAGAEGAESLCVWERRAHVVAPTAVVHAGQNGVEAAGGASVVAVGPTGVALLDAAYTVVACGYRVLSPTYMGTCSAT